MVLIRKAFRGLFKIHFPCWIITSFIGLALLWKICFVSVNDLNFIHSKIYPWYTRSEIWKSVLVEGDVESWKKTLHLRNRMVRILFWNKFYDQKELMQDYCLGEEGQKRQKEICEYQCEYTRDRKLINSSQAVVFHGRNLQIKNSSHVDLSDLPEQRITSQHWIFLMLESPTNTWRKLWNVGNIFNWTMSYRRDSDIFVPYGKVAKRQNDTHFTLERIRAKSKPKLIAWINSNCRFQKSNRNKLVAELRKYVRIHIYGKCGTFNCSKVNDNMCKDLQSCYKEIGKDYKFYLAFENSLCEDYITEKAFYALNHNMVPVVYGHVDYNHYLPPNSYINVKDFNGVEQLASYLLHLDKHDEEYMKYFQWRQSHVILDDKFYLERGWCTLCTRLSVMNYKAVKTSAISNLERWWNYKNGSKVCVKPLANFNLSL